LIRSVKDPQYKNVFQTAMQIYTTYGAREFTKGVAPTAIRSAIFNAVRLPVYTESKRHLNEVFPTYTGSISTHFAAASSGALIGIIASNPIDVVKSKIQGSSSEKRMGDAFRQIYTQSGIGGFYKGFVPSLLKSGPHSVISFVLIDQLSLYFSGKELI